MMHKTCSIDYGHLSDLQKPLLTTDLDKKTFTTTYLNDIEKIHLIKYLLTTFIFPFLFNLFMFSIRWDFNNLCHLSFE